ncbi:MAG: NAD(P)-dependent oxidoreductase [Syntrophobacteria bacterium]|jgi:3-hydroxyisobutyrate dehydrogenase-like beta-hydroxyacid dehydrogenase
METVAFFGLGQMGQGMALRLLESGYPLGVYNRTREKTVVAVEKGAELFDNPATAVGAAGVLITMLSDDNAVAELVTEEVLQALGKGSIHLSMSTVSPAAVQDLLPRHAIHGVQYLACPVFGRPDAARAGKLWLCLAGEEEAKSRVRPLLDVMGQGVFDFGSHPPAANVVKLAGNFLIASAIEAMAEAFSLVEKNGADPNQAHALLTQTLFACPIYQNYGKFILAQSYDPPGFNLALGSKDVRLVRDTARESQVPMPLAGLLEDRFLRSLASGRGNMDWTAIAIDQRESAGLTVN